VAYLARRPGPPVMEGEPMPFDKLLSTSDIVSLHCPLTPTRDT
jgi:phosphoglycerate dehydrogenase-like enzyme